MNKRPYKRVPALLCAVLCLLLMAGCTGASQSVEPQPAPTEALLPEAFPMDFTFASGAGGWATYLTLEQDGSFTGDFHDSNMGEAGDGYPNGSVYFCSFSGRFGDIKQLDDRTWSMTLMELTIRDKVGTEEIEEGVRYVASDPYGMDGGTEFLLYAPETPVDGLDEDLLSWWPGRYTYGEEPSDTLSYYGLYNREMGYGFFA